jgi:hypothetical protein
MFCSDLIRCNVLFSNIGTISAISLQNFNLEPLSHSRFVLGNAKLTSFQRFLSFLTHFHIHFASKAQLNSLRSIRSRSLNDFGLHIMLQLTKCILLFQLVTHVRKNLFLFYQIFLLPMMVT